MRALKLLCFFFIILACAVCPAATSDEFLNSAFSNALKLQAQNAGKPTTQLSKGDTKFLPMTELIRGQSEISVDNIFSKMREKETKKDFRLDPTQNKYILTYDQGRSSVPLADPIEVVKGPMGYLVLDGHHDLFLSYYLGAETIAAVVKEDLSKLNPLEFWKEMKKRGLIYMEETPDQLAEKTPAINAVKDNPNRYMAALLALKAKVENKDGKDRVIEKKGPLNGIWMKLNNSVPFIEFIIAKILKNAGIEYKSEWGDKIPPETVEKSRTELLKAQASGVYPELSRIPLIDSVAATKLSGGSEHAIIDVAHSLPVNPIDCGLPKLYH